MSRIKLGQIFYIARWRNFENIGRLLGRLDCEFLQHTPNIYVGPHIENCPLYIMDDPASILGRAVPVLMVGPVNYGLHLFGDIDFSTFVDW